MERNNNKGEIGIRASAECCMCGDFGLSSHLFRCKHCQFRDQHRYCSDLYPEAKSYNICNWCLSQKKSDVKIRGIEVKAKSCSLPKSCPSSNIDDMRIKRKTVLGNTNKGSLEGKKVAPPTDQVPQMMKTSFRADRPNPSSAVGGKRVMIKKRIITRTSQDMSNVGVITRRSQEMSNVGGNHHGMIVKRVFRHKVRRYKLLDEVSN